MLLIGVILILGIFAIIGWRKGLIKIVLSLAAMIVTIVASVVIAPVATSAIKRGTNIDENLAQSIYELLSNNKEIDNYFAEGNELPVNIDTSQIANYIKSMNVMIGEISDKVNLPESMTNTLKEIPESEIMGIVEDYSSTSVKELTLKIISVRLADIVLTAIVYILIMVVVFIALRIIISATGIVRRLPVIKQADKIGGVVVGFIEGLVVVWIFFTIVTAISGTETASNILLQIHGNTFLEALYNYNPITRVLFSTIR